MHIVSGLEEEENEAKMVTYRALLRILLPRFLELFAKRSDGFVFSLEILRTKVSKPLQ